MNSKHDAAKTPDNDTGAINPDDRATRVRDDGRRDTDLDDDRTDQRMAARKDANRQAEADAEDGEQIDHGSQGREGMGQARQTDGS